MNTADAQELRNGVAVQIMGWHEARIGWAYDATASLWHDESGTPLLTVHSWRPDESDEQCMQVVDRMLERGFSLQLHCNAEGTRARFESGSMPGAEDSGPERRMSVIRAALAAVAVAD